MNAAGRDRQKWSAARAALKFTHPGDHFLAGPCDLGIARSHSRRGIIHLSQRCWCYVLVQTRKSKLKQLATTWNRALTEKDIIPTTALTVRLTTPQCDRDVPHDDRPRLPVPPPRDDADSGDERDRPPLRTVVASGQTRTPMPMRG